MGVKAETGGGRKMLKDFLRCLKVGNDKVSISTAEAEEGMGMVLQRLHLPIGHGDLDQLLLIIVFEGGLLKGWILGR